jgi:hypothetical protein
VKNRFLNEATLPVHELHYTKECSKGQTIYQQFAFLFRHSGQSGSFSCAESSVGPGFYPGYRFENREMFNAEAQNGQPGSGIVQMRGWVLGVGS